MRVPGYDPRWIVGGLLTFMLALLFTLLRIAARLAAAYRTKNRDSSPGIMAGWRVWLLYPSAAIFLVLLGLLRLPFKVAWALSRPSLDRFAKSYDPASKSVGKQSIGLFCFSAVDYSPDRLQLTFDKDEFPWGQRGFYFSPGGVPVAGSHYYDQQALGNGWHEWHYGGW